jgi:hypothetical protein
MPKSVYSNFYVITFQYFHLYLSALALLFFSVVRSVLSFNLGTVNSTDLRGLEDENMKKILVSSNLFLS